MTLRQYIFFLFLGTIIGWVAWFMVVNNIDPTTASPVAFTAFYFALFIGLTGLFSSGGTLVRSSIYKERAVEEIVTTSLRQGIFLGLLIVSSLILISQELLEWWLLAIIITGVGLLELFFLSIKSKNS